MVSGDLLDDRRCRAKSKRTGERCRRFPAPGATVCHFHGGASRLVRAAAERRRTEAEASALLELLWDPTAAPITDPIEALQRLAGRLQHAADVLGARLEGAELDGATGLAWVRVLRELRQALEGMERLDLTKKQVALEQDKAKMVGLALDEGLQSIGVTAEQRQVFVEVFVRRLRVLDGGVPPPAVAVERGVTS